MVAARRGGVFAGVVYMLVLARQRDQTIIIGDDVEVTVVDIRGDKVRLGVNAPRTVSVHRKEVYDAIRRENQLAATIKPGDVPHMGISGNGGPIGKIEPAAAPVQRDQFMDAAIEEARKGMAEGGLPIGSVLVRDGKIISRGHNQRVQKGDPMAHAEIDCLTNAGRQKTYRDTVLYSTLMPCFLCSGAVVQFGVPKVVVGESVNFTGGPEFMRRHGVQVTDLRDSECIEMMRKFIAEHPELWHEDIGK
jgi:cytosine/creatinine deaminase